MLNQDGYPIARRNKSDRQVLYTKSHFTPYKCLPLQSNEFSFSETSEINLRPNSLDPAGIQQVTCKKCLKPKNKVLASSALETPSRNAFGFKNSVQKDH